MVVGLLSRKGYHNNNDNNNRCESRGSPSSVSNNNRAAASANLGGWWRFPLRAESLLSFPSKDTNHPYQHIVHPSTQDGIGQLNHYLQKESAINTNNNLAMNSVPTTPNRPDYYSMFGSVKSRRTAPQRYRDGIKNTGGFGAADYRNTIQLDMRNDSLRIPSRPKANDIFALPYPDMVGRTSPPILVASPPLEQQVPNSRSPTCSSTDGSDTIEAKSKPRSADVYSLYGTDTNDIIDLYTGISSDQTMVDPLLYKGLDPLSGNHGRVIDNDSNHSESSIPGSRKQSSVGNWKCKDGNLKRQSNGWEHELLKRMADEKQRHEQEMASQRKEMQQQLDSLNAKYTDVVNEKDEYHSMLEEYVATSARLLEEKEVESGKLGRELARLTLDGQTRQESLSEAESRIQALSKEHRETQDRLDLLTAENVRLGSLTEDMRNDVLVAEDRCKKIKEHAEDMMAKANTEIERLQNNAKQTEKEMDTLRSQITKSETRAKSLQIRLESTKNQNIELLDLCEKLENSNW